MSNKNYYIFSTCRIAYLDHPEIKHIKLLKKLHSNHYKLNDNNIFTQPVNYTVKLRDVLDSILYLKGQYDLSFLTNTNNKIINDILHQFNKMFFTFSAAETIPPKTYPLKQITSNKEIIFDKCVLEIWNLKEYIFNSGPFINKNLPFKIQSVHRSYNKNLFNIKEYNTQETHEIIKYIKNLIKCPILIVGPYLSKTRPKEVNDERKKTQDILKSICNIENIQYFDMTDEIRKNQSIIISNIGKESDETHWSDEGKKIISKVIYDFLI